jgi:hypothetical protein
MADHVHQPFLAPVMAAVADGLGADLPDAAEDSVSVLPRFAWPTL